jgi:hypothetical protein
MLEAFIIEELEKERRKRRLDSDSERPRLRIPLYPDAEERPPVKEDQENEEGERGVVMIDFS